VEVQGDCRFKRCGLGFAREGSEKACFSLPRVLWKYRGIAGSSGAGSGLRAKRFLNPKNFIRVLYKQQRVRATYGA
jgi:hypothetical protein